MFDPDPGKDQKPHIVDHLVEVAFAGLRIPSDEGIPGGHFQRSRGPSHGGHQMAVEMDEVLEVGTHEQRTGQVVVSMDQEVPQGFFSALADHGQGQGPVIRDLSFQRGLVQKEIILALDTFFAPGSLVAPRRQLNLAVSFQCEQEVPARTVLEPAIGLGPFPLPAQGLGYGGAAQHPFLANAAADHLEVFRADLPSTDGVKSLSQCGTSQVLEIPLS